MWDLYKSEFGRFHRMGSIAALLHLALLMFYGRLIDPLQQPLLVHQIVSACYWLAALLLGLVQIAAYRRPHAWLQLLHRPLAPWRIALALLAASATWLVVVVSLPLILMLWSQTSFSARVVDWRHWQIPLAAWLVAVCALESAAVLLLGARRVGACVLVASAWMLASQASGPELLAVLLACTCVAIGLHLAVFQPALESPPRNAVGRGLLLGCLAMGVYLVLLAGLSLGWQMIGFATGTHPLNGGAQPGGYLHASRAESRDLLDAGLAAGRDSRIGLWRAQLELSEPLTLRFNLAPPPAESAMGNPEPLEIDDEERGVRYVYSVDRRLFLGRRLADRQGVPSLGQGGAMQAFAATPVPIDNSLLVARGTLFQFDPLTPRIDARIALPEGEVILSAPQLHGDLLYVLGSAALYGFPAREFERTAAVLQPSLRLPVPFPASELDRVDLFDVLDGQVVSWLRGADSVDTAGLATQTLWLATGPNAPSLLSERQLGPDFPDALRYLGWWLSPVLQGLAQEARMVLAPAPPLAERQAPPRPASMLGLALASHLLAALLAWRLLRHRPDLCVRESRIWWGFATLLGVPGLLSVWLFLPQAVRAPRPIPHSQRLAGLA